MPESLNSPDIAPGWYFQLNRQERPQYWQILTPIVIILSKYRAWEWTNLNYNVDSIRGQVLTTTWMVLTTTMRTKKACPQNLWPKLIDDMICEGSTITDILKPWCRTLWQKLINDKRRTLEDLDNDKRWRDRRNKENILQQQNLKKGYFAATK